MKSEEELHAAPADGGGLLIARAWISRCSSPSPRTRVTARSGVQVPALQNLSHLHFRSTPCAVASAHEIKPDRARLQLERAHMRRSEPVRARTVCATRASIRPAAVAEGKS
jgi:hypothetical protein